MIYILILWFILIIYWIFSFYKFYNNKNYFIIYNILKDIFKPSYLIKTQIKNLFKIDYSENENYYNFFNKRIIIWHTPNLFNVINWFLIYTYSQIEDKDNFFDKIYNLIWNNPIFYEIENCILEENWYFKDEKFFEQLYYKIFFNIDKFDDTNINIILKKLYFLK